MVTIGENTQGKRATKKHADAWLCLRFAYLSLNSFGTNFDSKDCSSQGSSSQGSSSQGNSSQNHKGEKQNDEYLANAITESQQIWQCNAAAISSGVRPGMSHNHALMLLPEIICNERDSKLETQKLHELSYWAYRFSSLVSIYNDHTLLLEIGRSVKLFNGLQHLIHLIKNDLSDFKIDVKIGIANTAKAAYVLSFNSKLNNRHYEIEPDQLKQAALKDLDINPKSIGQLHNCGFETIQDISNIPAAELGQRFGVEFLNYMDQLWGRVADPQTCITPPEHFELSADFAEPISNLAWINQQLDRLLNDLLRFTVQRQLICRSFTWRFFHENNRLLQTVAIGLSAKQNNFDTLRELTDLKLANIELDWEFASIELSSTQLVPKQLFNDDLFSPQADQQQFNQLIDKLSNRLGHTALFRVRQADEYLPELANDRQHAVQETSPSYTALSGKAAMSHTNGLNQKTANNKDKVFKDQPLWLLQKPQRLAQQQQQPRHQGPLNIIHGPDRITSHWWSKIQSRDYFIARQRNGRLLWIFFDRGEKSWFLHGLFA